MSAGARARAALAEIPGWADARISPLRGGRTNAAWLAEADGRRAVLKVDSAPRRFPLNSRRDEAQVQRAAASAGLATDVLYARDGIYLSAWAEGQVWDPRTFDEPGRLAALARRLRRLHSLPLTGRRFDAAAAAADYFRMLRNRPADRAQAAHHLETVRNVRPGVRLCCCHNDLVAENIVSTPDIVFIDWDYAGDNDPLFDLATITEHHRLAPAAAHALLDAYFDGAGNAWLPQLERMRRLYAALTWLWEASQDGAVTTGCAAPEA